MKFKYDTSTDEGKAQVMLEFAKTKKQPVWTFKRSASGQWLTHSNKMWNWAVYDYNYPLEPKLVPWTLETVPKIGVLFKFENRIGTNYYNSECFTNYGVKFPFDIAAISYEKLRDIATHSLDGGVTWLACGRVE